MKIWLCIGICLLWSCKKNSVDILTVHQLQLPYSIRIEAIEVEDNGRMHTVGGHAHEEGWYLYSSHDHQVWTAERISHESSVYAMHIDTMGTSWLGGDDLKLWKKTDGGSWQFHWLGDQVPTHEEDRPAIRAFLIQGDSHIYMAGGYAYNKGIVYASDDTGATWDFLVTNQMQEDLFWHRGQVVSAGFGGGYQYAMGNWTHGLTLPDHLVSVLSDEANNKWAASSTGRLYQFQAAGDQWIDSRQHHNTHVVWMAGTSKEARFVFGGSKGEIMFSDDRGNNWQHNQLSEEFVIRSMALAGDTLWCGSDQGLMYWCILP
jgi:photosystem II stability/assembly factor-like uncharacterized protein